MYICPRCRELFAELHLFNNHHCLGAAIHLGQTISHGTLRHEDLIPKFEILLRELDPIEFGHLHSWIEGQPGDAEDHDEYVVRLVDALDAAAPEGWYFGTLEGDGSDYGFWRANPHE